MAVGEFGLSYNISGKIGLQIAFINGCKLLIVTKKIEKILKKIGKVQANNYFKTSTCDSPLKRRASEE